MTNRSTDGYMAEDMRLRGVLEGKGLMVIDGRFEGTIEMSGDLVVGPKGVVRGPVKAGSLAVGGRLEGEVEVRRAVAVRAGGVLVGDVRAERVSLAEGGDLVGAVFMDVDLPPDLLEPR